MYKNFYKFSCEPFDTQPDPSFLWLGEKYKEALSILRYGILDNKGFLLLTGEAGTGKTSLLKSLVQTLGDDTVWAVIANPNLHRMDFFNALAEAFGLPKQYSSKVEFMLDFGTFLQNAHDSGKKVVLIIDSAQLLPQENIEELRLLSNIEKVDTKLINIFFVAQPLFTSLLAKPKNSALRQRLTLNYTIEPLTPQETAEYIQYRLRVAGVENRLITDKAVRAIHQYSGGIPRKINVLCQQVLTDGAQQGRKVIDQGAVQECMNKMTYGGTAVKFDFAKNMSTKERILGGRKVNRQVVAAVSSVLIFAGIAFIGFPYLDRVLFGPQDFPVIKTETVKEPAKTAVAMVEKKPEISSHQPNPKEPSASGTTPEAKSAGSISQPPALIPDKPVVSSAQPDRSVENSESRKIDSEQKATVTTVPKDAVVEIVTGRVEKASETVAKDQNTNTSQPPSTAPSKDPEILVQKTLPDKPDQKNPQEHKESKPEIVSAKAILPLQANSLSLTSAGQKELDKFLQAVKASQKARIEIRGYVSSKDNSEENIKLSVTRAETVQQLLIKKGISENQLLVKGMGNKDPLASNDTVEGRNKNRRVEVEIIP